MFKFFGKSIGYRLLLCFCVMIGLGLVSYYQRRIGDEALYSQHEYD